MSLATILRGLASRTNFAGDDGAKDDMMRQIDELDVPPPAPVAAPVDADGDGIPDGANA